jgi:hypothetical protein
VDDLPTYCLCFARKLNNLEENDLVRRSMRHSIFRKSAYLVAAFIFFFSICVGEAPSYFRGCFCICVQPLRDRVGWSACSVL